MAEMKDSGIEWCGKIPTSWNVMPNKYVMHKKKEICPKYNGEDILSLTMDGVIVRDLDAGGKMPASFDGYQRVKPNNLLMCLFDYDVTPRCIGLIQNEGLTSPAYSQFIMKNGNDARYYYYYYLMIDNTKELLHLSKNLRHSFTEDQLGAINTPVPLVKIQKQIAKYLDQKCEDIDAVYSDIEKQIETLEEYKKSIITEAVTKGLDPDVEMKDSGSVYWKDIPVNWKLSDIKYLFEIVKRIAGKEGYDILSVTQKGLKIKDISKNEGQIAESYANYQFVYPTDYVMNHMDLLTGWVDCSKYFGVTSPDYRVFRLKDKKNNLNYYKYIMQCCYMDRIFYSLGQGVSNLGRWRLQTESFNNFQIPVPPAKEQEQIAKYLDEKCIEIENIILDKQQQLETLEQYKKSLIYEYVTGKKEVSNE